MGTESEAILSQLCQRSFLSLWSYPNPYNDKGLATRKEGKELCDLLVIFGNDVIIFSDKSCAYPNTGDEQLDWKRWYKRAVQDSIDQIAGAERWLRQHPERVFADNRCEVPLDVRIPPVENIRIHRVVVALGARERCQARFGGGTGSLPIHGGGTQHDGQSIRRPFLLGDDGGTRGFVHVFDDVGLNVVLRELDTAADFVEYLRKKEDLFASYPVVATGEEDLLAHYLLTMVGDEHAFLPPPDPSEPEGHKRLLFVDEGAFPSLIGLPQYTESKRANKPSYMWDGLIEHFTDFYRRRELHEGVSVDEFERALRAMAAPGRVVRRQLGRMLMSALETADPDRARYISVIDPPTVGSMAYGVVCLSYKGDISYDTYRDRRQLLMQLYARSLRVRIDSVRQVLVVGIQPTSDQGSSEDMALIDLPDWTPEMDEETRQDMKLFGLGAPPRHIRDHEFPVVRRHLGAKEAERRRKQMERDRKKHGG